MPLAQGQVLFPGIHFVINWWSFHEFAIIDVYRIVSHDASRLGLCYPCIRDIKHLMTGPEWNSEFCFPRRSRGKH